MSSSNQMQQTSSNGSNGSLAAKIGMVAVVATGTIGLLYSWYRYDLTQRLNQPIQNRERRPSPARIQIVQDEIERRSTMRRKTQQNRPTKQSNAATQDRQSTNYRQSHANEVPASAATTSSARSISSEDTPQVAANSTATKPSSTAPAAAATNAVAEKSEARPSLSNTNKWQMPATFEEDMTAAMTSIVQSNPNTILINKYLNILRSSSSLLNYEVDSSKLEIKQQLSYIVQMTILYYSFASVQRKTKLSEDSITLDERNLTITKLQETHQAAVRDYSIALHQIEHMCHMNQLTKSPFDSVDSMVALDSEFAMFSVDLIKRISNIPKLNDLYQVLKSRAIRDAELATDVTMFEQKVATGLHLCLSIAPCLGHWKDFAQLCELANTKWPVGEDELQEIKREVGFSPLTRLDVLHLKSLGQPIFDVQQMYLLTQDIKAKSPMDFVNNSTFGKLTFATLSCTSVDFQLISVESPDETIKAAVQQQLVASGKDKFSTDYKLGKLLWDIEGSMAKVQFPGQIASLCGAWKEQSKEFDLRGFACVPDPTAGLLIHVEDQIVGKLTSSVDSGNKTEKQYEGEYTIKQFTTDQHQQPDRLLVQQTFHFEVTLQTIF